MQWVNPNSGIIDAKISNVHNYAFNVFRLFARRSVPRCGAGRE